MDTEKEIKRIIGKAMILIGELLTEKDVAPQEEVSEDTANTDEGVCSAGVEQDQPVTLPQNLPGEGDPDKIFLETSISSGQVDPMTLSCKQAKAELDKMKIPYNSGDKTLKVQCMLYLNINKIPHDAAAPPKELSKLVEKHKITVATGARVAQEQVPAQSPQAQLPVNPGFPVPGAASPPQETSILVQNEVVTLASLQAQAALLGNHPPGSNNWPQVITLVQQYGSAPSGNLSEISSEKYEVLSRAFTDALAGRLPA